MANKRLTSAAQKSVYALASAVLLTLSFPSFHFSFLVWIALVPLLVLVDGKKPGEAFVWAWLTGFLFFLGTHYWLMHVTLPGMVLVCLYLGVYFGLFGWGLAVLGQGQSFFRVLPDTRPLTLVKDGCRFLFIPCFWVVCELARDRLLTGFGWACLGHAQYQNLVLIQAADLTGVFGVSFIIALVNGLVALILMRGCSRNWIMILNQDRGKILGGVLLLAGCLLYGGHRMAVFAAADPMTRKDTFQVGVVQSNIPQAEKWKSQSEERIQQQLLEQTEKILKLGNPTVVIWPETSFPGYMWLDPGRFEEIKTFVRQKKISLLLGAVTVMDKNYFNSALLLSPDGNVVEQYDKQHLVPFGEFLPLRPLLNFIEYFVPIGDFTRGTRLTVFPGGYSVLICFEDTVAVVVRSLVQTGARYLVNISNDGWFKNTNEPYLHLQCAVLQSVAHRRVMIRCGNTGISSKVDLVGRVTRLKNEQNQSVMVTGQTLFEMNRGELLTTRTFYTRWGDVFAVFCLIFSFALLINRKKLL